MKRFISLIFMILLISNIGSAAQYAVSNNDDLQVAIDNATEGDTVYVSGVHPENIQVHTQGIVIKSNDAEVAGFQVYEPNVTIDGFKITSSGIRITDQMSECTIVNNEIVNDGIALDLGTVLNTIKNNTVYDCSDGIEFSECYNNIVHDNVIMNCDNGMLLSYSSSNEIKDNTIVQNRVGINFIESGSNFVNDNKIKYNSLSGITIGEYSGNNNIYNNYFSNHNNVVIEDSTLVNNWNVTKRNGSNIIGDSCISGNYWATPDNTGFSQVNVDTNGDCIADVPYVIDENNIDYGVLIPEVLVPDAPVDTNNNIVEVPVEPVEEVESGGSGPADSNNNTTEVPVETPVEEIESSGGGGGGSHHSSSGSVGGSPEPQENVATKETVKAYIGHANKNVIRLKTGSTNISSIEFNISRSFNNQPVIVEELKNQSELTQGRVPPSSPIEYFNIWVGSTSAINKNNLKNATIYFKLSNNISEINDISVYRYDNDSWIACIFEETDRDSDFTYYKVNTDEYGQFVICGDPLETMIIPVNKTETNTTDSQIKSQKISIWQIILDILEKMFG